MPIDRGQSRLPRHPLGWHDQNQTAHLLSQFAQIVEQVIDLRVAQVSEFGLTCRAVQPISLLLNTSSVKVLRTDS
ncbi:MAG: hypothetical protein JJE16_15770 [Nitrospiraceae bacterium]|nr:hypothetical protein [Nitrospiraceae bacterium]